MRVSVLIPVRNAGSTLPDVIADLRAQTLTDWEAVFIDDGSDDSSAGQLQTAARADSRIRVRHTSPQGISRALNTGLSLCRSPIIARMDADDRMRPDRLEKQVTFLGRYPEIGLVSSLAEFGGDPKQQAGYAAYVDWTNSIVAVEAIALNRFVESPLPHPSVAFRKSLPLSYGPYREGPFPEDYELWLRWMDGGVQMAKIAEPLIRWNDSPGRISRTDPRYHPTAFFATKAEYLARAVIPRLNGRSLWVWGAGRRTRKRAGFLEGHGLSPVAYIDIDPRKIGQMLPSGRPVCAPEEIPAPDQAFVLGFVAKRGAREIIRASLLSRGFREGDDFLMCG